MVTIDIEAQTDEGQRLFAGGRFAEADVVFRSVLRSRPNDPRALLGRGQIALLGNRFEAASGHLIRAFTAGARQSAAGRLLGELYYRQDRFSEAAAYLAGTGQRLLASKLDSLRGHPPYEISFETVPARIGFLTTDPLPLLTARVNGGPPRTLMIDTGGGELILDHAVARESGVEELGREQGVLAGGTTGVQGHGTIKTLDLDGVQVRNLPVTTMDTSWFGRQLEGRRVDGVIGTVLLYHFLARLDYPAGELVLWPKSEPVATTGQVAVPFWLVGDHFMVACGQVNRQPLLLLVDTGLAGKGFTCPESTVAAAGITLEPDRAETATIAGNTITITPFSLAELALGELTAWQVPGSYGPFPPGLEQSLGVNIGGVVSHAFFKPYAITWDFTRMLMHFDTTRPDQPR